VELVSFLQLVQTNVPDVQAKNHQDMKIMIPVAVDTVTNPFSDFSKIFKLILLHNSAIIVMFLRKIRENPLA